MFLAVTLAPPVAEPQSVWGRRGFSWQPEIELAKEELARLEAELDELSDEEWRDRALAWLRLAPLRGNVLEIVESDRVHDLGFRRKADIRPLGPDEPVTAWRIDFGSRPQRTVAVEMTDEDRTRLPCPLGGLLATGGWVGVFQHDGYLVCVDRRPAS